MSETGLGIPSWMLSTSPQITASGHGCQSNMQLFPFPREYMFVCVLFQPHGALLFCQHVCMCECVCCQCVCGLGTGGKQLHLFVEGISASRASQHSTTVFVFKKENENKGEKQTLPPICFPVKKGGGDLTHTEGGGEGWEGHMTWRDRQIENEEEKEVEREERRQDTLSVSSV